MILDAMDSKVALDRTATIAIVGAGPAGITLARELSGIADILLVEGGGMKADPECQSLFEGDIAGLDYPLVETRCRQFGGSSALWAGYCAIFDPHDVAPRPWVEHSGWPIGYDAIARYHPRAAAALNLRDACFDGRVVDARAGRCFPFDPARFVGTAWRFGCPTMRFGARFAGGFAARANPTTLIHANLVDIRLDAGQSAVTELVVRTTNGREGRIAADLFILACGGIESARQLLNADGQIRSGLGNAHGFVGRCFMEHPHLPVPALELKPDPFFDSWVGRGGDDGAPYVSAIGLSPAVQADARILNARGHVYRTPAMGEDEAPRLGVFLEQAPKRDSRITLSDDRDRLGLRRVRLDWRLGPLDWQTYRTTATLFAQEFVRLGLGTFATDRAIADVGDGDILHSNHHLGTTRMSDDPEAGVVDRDCRVHGLENLYIAGGSVFPTASWANPTVTVVALAYRLADHLRGRLGKADAGGAKRGTVMQGERG